MVYLVWTVCPLPQSPPLTALVTLMSSKVLACEFHILLELEIPTPAHARTWCFGCISPAWTTGLDPFWDKNQDWYSFVFHQGSNRGASERSSKAEVVVLPSGERLVNPQFAQQYVRNAGHHIQTALWLFFLSCWGEFRRDPWKIKALPLGCLFEIKLVLLAAGFRAQEDCQLPCKHFATC